MLFLFLNRKNYVNLERGMKLCYNRKGKTLSCSKLGGSVMINLLKRKPSVFSKESTAEEVYQQEHYYRLTIIDKAGAMKKLENADETMEDLFEAMKNRRVKEALKIIFGSKYEFVLFVTGFGYDRIVEVVITKKSRFGKNAVRSC